MCTSRTTGTGSLWRTNRRASVNRRTVMRLQIVIGTVAAGLLLTVAPLSAQDARGTILGRVTDATGAVIAAAKIEAVNTDTGVHYSSTSNSAGDYILPY